MSQSFCPAHPNPNCPKKNEDGQCAYCGFNFEMHYLVENDSISAVNQSRLIAQQRSFDEKQLINNNRFNELSIQLLELSKRLEAVSVGGILARITALESRIADPSDSATPPSVAVNSFQDRLKDIDNKLRNLYLERSATSSRQESHSQQLASLSKNSGEVVRQLEVLKRDMDNRLNTFANEIGSAKDKTANITTRQDDPEKTKLQQEFQNLASKVASLEKKLTNANPSGEITRQIDVLKREIEGKLATVARDMGSINSKVSSFSNPRDTTDKEKQQRELQGLTSRIASLEKQQSSIKSQMTSIGKVGKKQNLHIIVSKCSIDAAFEAFVMASTAAQLGNTISMFFTLMGIHLLRSDISRIEIGYDAKNGLSDISTSSFKSLAKSNGVATIEELRDLCSDTYGIRFTACQMSAELLLKGKGRELMPLNIVWGGYAGFVGDALNHGGTVISI